MSANGDSLRKVLELESRKGYADSAVIGGLDRFLHNWVAPTAAAMAHPALLKRFRKLFPANSNYASLTRAQRQEWVQNVLDFLADMEAGGKAEASPATVVSPPPVKLKVKRTQPNQSVDLPVTAVKGISSVLATRFNKLGVKTVRDLLYFFPHRHLDYSQSKTIAQLSEGEEQTIVATVWQARLVRLGSRQSTEAIVGDETGNVRVVWFNNPYLAKTLRTNSRLVISGRVGLFRGQYVFESPEWELVEEKELVHTGRLVPLYPLTEGLHPRQVRKLMKEAVDQWAGQLTDFQPAELRERQKFLELSQAISQAHFPESEEMKTRARIRLAFDELFLLQVGVLSKKRYWQDIMPGNLFQTQAA